MKKYHWLTAGLIVLVIGCSEFGVRDEAVGYCGVTDTVRTPDSLLSASLLPGRKLFEENCGPCHSISKELTGPALDNIIQRMKEIDPQHPKMLYAFTRNSTKMIREGNIYFGMQYARYNATPQNYFPSLTDEDLRQLYAYIEYVTRQSRYNKSTPLSVTPHYDSCLANLMKAGYLISWEDTKQTDGTIVIKHKSAIKIKHNNRQNRKERDLPDPADEAWQGEMVSYRFKSGLESVPLYKVYYKRPKDSVLCSCLLKKP